MVRLKSTTVYRASPVNTVKCVPASNVARTARTTAPCPSWATTNATAICSAIANTRRCTEIAVPISRRLAWANKSLDVCLGKFFENLVVVIVCHLSNFSIAPH